MALTLALPAGPGPQAVPAPPASDGLPVIVHLADGTSVPLRAWTLSYEYLAWPPGSSQVMATPARREGRELWAGKKVLDTTGLTLELAYESVRREPAEGSTGPAEVPVVRRLRLRWADGRRSEPKPEPPHRDLLIGTAAKDLLLLARSLDLRGETLTGTRRELCVLSYTSLVECGVEAGGRVVKIEFPGKE